MAGTDDEFHDKERHEAEEKSRVDFTDAQDELAGIHTKAPRFAFLDTLEERDPKRRERAESKKMTQLQILLMSNAAYAKLYEDTWNKLLAAEAATERALALAIEASGKAGHLLEETLSQAQQLPDGTHVFRDAKGNVWTEDGRRIQGEAADAIEWRGNEPAYEDYLARKQAAEDSQGTVSKLRTYQVDVLGHARHRLTDESDPMDFDELETMNKAIDDQAPPMVRKLMQEGSSLQAVPSLDNLAPLVDLSGAGPKS